MAKYGIINEVLYEWYIKCCQAGFYPDGKMLQEELLNPLDTEGGSVGPQSRCFCYSLIFPKSLHAVSLMKFAHFSRLF